MMLFFFLFIPHIEGGMLRQKPLVISLVLAGLIASTDTSALGLGRLNVTTALGQPLVAEVDLSIAPGDDFDSIRANIAAPAVYRGANVEYQGILQTIRVQPLRRANGQPFLRLTSNQAVNEPFLDVLIEVNSNTGRLVREFVVLLDPAGTSQPQSVDATNNPRTTITSPAPSAMSAPVAPAPRGASTGSATRAPAMASQSSAASGGGYTVKGGDTLYGIASKNNPGGVSIEQLMIAIQRANPGAFIGGNINRLRSGVNLSLPTASEAGAIASSDAVSEVRAQTASWRGYVSRISESVPTVASDAAQARASGKVSGAVSDTATSGPSSDKLKLSQGERSKSAAAESKVATSKAIKEEQSRAAELEKTKQNLEKALSLKSQTMADTQAKAKEAAKPTIVAAAPAPSPSLAPAPVIAAPTPAPAAPPIVAAPPPAPIPAPAPAPIPAPAPAPVEPPPAAAPVAATPAAPPPAPAPTPAPAPAPVAPAAATPAADDGIMGMITENPLVPAGLAAVLLAIGGLIWSRRRNAAKSSSPDSKLSEPVVNTVNPDTVFGTSGLGVVKTNDAPIASQFSRSGMGTIDAGEVDPVAEAEVYIAYGREAQAEEILREALARDPQRADVATKLAEMAAAQGDQGGFDKWVADIGKMDRGGEYQSRLGELAAAHFPGHTLAASAASSAAVAKAASFGQGSASSGKDAGFGALAAGGAVAAAATAAASSDAAMNFFTAAPAPATPAAKPIGAEKSNLDFVLDGMTVVAPSSMDKVVPTVIPTIKPGDSSKKKSLEDDLADLEASLKKATSSGQLPESSMDFTDFSTATPTNLGTVGPAMRPEMLDLSFDAGRSGTMEPTPSILDGQWHDAATKLDLARAYEEMGDQEGAREILREVIHDGDDTQKAEARALLAKLGG
jgi:pilus assembly protein FimV